MNQTESHLLDIPDLTVEDFRARVLEDPRPVLIDFWAPWCMPCRIMKPLFHQAAHLLKGEVRAVRVNVDEEPRLSEAFGIQGIPTLVLIKDGRVLDSWSGVISVGELAEWVRSRLAGG